MSIRKYSGQYVPICDVCGHEEMGQPTRDADDVALSAMREKRARIDIDRVQDEYKAMKGGVKPFTKKALCELCVPFRDRYGLTDRDAISIASQRMALKEAVALCRRSMTEGSAEHE